MTSTAVLIHGCHLQADLNGQSWEDIVWGLKDGKPTMNGRATMGIQTALTEAAEKIIFSTGASEIAGVKEALYTYQHALLYLNDLAHLYGVSSNFLHNFIQEHYVLDLESQNTAQECRRNFLLCADAGIETVILVSSPWHIQRCHTEALKVAEAMRNEGQSVPRILTEASYGPTEGVVILEPSHRGDQRKNSFCEFGGRFFKIPPSELERFQVEQDMLLSSYGA